MSTVDTRPGVYVTEAPPPHQPHGLNGLHRDDLSVVHLAAPVHDTKLPHAAMSVLWALGKREGVTGMHEQLSRNVPLVPIWLTAHRTRTIIISAAQRWRPRLTQEISRNILTAGTSIVLVADNGRRDEVNETAKGFLPEAMSLDELKNACPAPHHPDESLGHEWLTTPLPDSDWPTFRAHCREALPDSAFIELDHHYRQALKATQLALRQQPTRDDQTTRQLLIDLLEETNHHAQATAVLRATQAAHFVDGYNLRIDIGETIALMSQSRSISFTARDWRALRAYREPGRAAACALYGLQMPVAHIEATTVGDIDEGLNAGTLNNQKIPDDAAAILRAARLERTLDGATTDDPFIVCSAVASMLTNAAKDLGILVASTANRRSKHTANFWQYRIGFHLQRIK